MKMAEEVHGNSALEPWKLNEIYMECTIKIKIYDYKVSISCIIPMDVAHSLISISKVRIAPMWLKYNFYWIANELLYNLRGKLSEMPFM